MGDVIAFPANKELKEVVYTGVEGGNIGVSTSDRRIEIVKLNEDEFALITPKGSQRCNRKALAEFMWVASIFLDSEKRFYPEVDLIGCDY